MISCIDYKLGVQMCLGDGGRVGGGGGGRECSNFFLEKMCPNLFLTGNHEACNIIIMQNYDKCVSGGGGGGGGNRLMKYQKVYH